MLVCLNNAGMMKTSLTRIRPPDAKEGQALKIGRYRDGANKKALGANGFGAGPFCYLIPNRSTWPAPFEVCFPTRCPAAGSCPTKAGFPSASAVN